jgi:hypothetical protein
MMSPPRRRSAAILPRARAARSRPPVAWGGPTAVTSTAKPHGIPSPGSHSALRPMPAAARRPRRGAAGPHRRDQPARQHHQPSRQLLGQSRTGASGPAVAPDVRRRQEDCFAARCARPDRLLFTPPAASGDVLGKPAAPGVRNTSATCTPRTHRLETATPTRPPTTPIQAPQSHVATTLRHPTGAADGSRTQEVAGTLAIGKARPRSSGESPGKVPPGERRIGRPALTHPLASRRLAERWQARLRAKCRLSGAEGAGFEPASA